MGKVVITVQMSADAGIGPSIEWFDGDDPDAGADELGLADAMLLGRKTYESLAPIWSNTPGGFADRVNRMPKYVASRSADEPAADWNGRLVTGDLAEGIRRIKQSHDGTLLTYGCGEFAFWLVRTGLADEIHFWVHPAVWPEQARPFHGLGRIRMRHKATTVFRGGVVRNAYEPVSVVADRV